jgi:hypothetical protein
MAVKTLVFSSKANAVFGSTAVATINFGSKVSASNEITSENLHSNEEINALRISSKLSLVF